MSETDSTYTGTGYIGLRVNSGSGYLVPTESNDIKILGVHHSVEYTEDGKLLFYRKGDTIGPCLTLWPDQVLQLFVFLKEHEESIRERG